MPSILFAATRPPARFCREAVVHLLTGLIVEIPAEDLRARVTGMPMVAQVPLVGNVLVAIALATLVFAHAGWGGPIAFWLTLALLAR